MQEVKKQLSRMLKNTVDFFPDVSKIITFDSGQSLRSAVFFSFQLISCIPVSLLLIPVNARKYSCAICKHEFNCTFSNPTIEFISQVHEFFVTQVNVPPRLFCPSPTKTFPFFFLSLLPCCLLLPKYFLKKNNR